MGAIGSESPLASEVSLDASLRGCRDDGYEDRAVVDLFSDLPVPNIPAAQLALIEPDFNAAGPQRFANPPGGLGILGGVAQENGARWLAHLKSLSGAARCRVDPAQAPGWVKRHKRSKRSRATTLTIA